MTTIAFTQVLPPKITGLTITGGVKSASLKWDASSTLTDVYDIYHSTTNSAASATLLASTESNHYAPASLSTSSNHYFWVKTKNQYGVSSLFNTILTGETFNQCYLTLCEDSVASVTTSIQTVQMQVWYTTASGTATSVGPSYFTTTVWGPSWTNPDYARVNDTNYATITIAGTSGSLRFKLSDLGVPSDATITGYQVLVTGKTTDYTYSHLKVGFAYGLDNATYVDTYPGSATDTFTANNTDQTKTIGTSTTTPGLVDQSIAPVIQDTISSGSIAGAVTVGSGSMSSGLGTSGFNGTPTYGSWYTPVYMTTTAAANNIWGVNGYVLVNISSVSCTGTDHLQVWYSYFLYDETTASAVPIGSLTSLIYDANASTGLNTGNLSQIVNISQSYNNGLNGALITGHSYTWKIQIMVQQTSGTPSCSINFNGSASSYSAVTF